jgi:hypothetical protein
MGSEESRETSVVVPALTDYMHAQELGIELHAPNHPYAAPRTRGNGPLLDATRAGKAPHKNSCSNTAEKEIHLGARAPELFSSR